jgi:branched-chain amino acid transport system substrate-binding protein
MTDEPYCGTLRSDLKIHLRSDLCNEDAMTFLRQTTLTLAAFAGLTAYAHADIKLGIAGPFTGSNAAIGAQMQNGAQQAVEDINAAGGILGQKIQSFTEDDASKPEQGVSIANKFAGTGVKFVIGNFNSSVSIPASEVYNENGIIQITPASTNPTFTERNLWNVFRTCGRDDQQGAVAGTYISAHFAGKKIAIVHDKTTYGKGLADETRKYLASKNIKDVLYEGINVGEADYAAIVSKIKASGADLIFFGGLYTEAGRIIRQMHDQGVKAVMMGGDGFASAELAAIGGEGVAGTLMTFGPDPTKRAQAADVVKKFKAKNFEPESYTLYSYAAVQVIKQAAEKANSLDPKKVADAIHSGMTFNTVIGTFSYDAKGDRRDADYVVYDWKKAADGKMIYEEVK